jgi:hypothetical protein
MKSKTVKFAIAGLPALLMSTAAMAADLAMPVPTTVTATGPGYTLTATGGVVAFGMPTQDTGVQATGAFTTIDPSVWAIGVQGGLSGSFDLAPAGAAGLSLGFDVFGAWAQGSDSTTVNFTGPGTVVIPGYTTPDGTIALTTAAVPGTVTSTTNGNAGPLGQMATVTGAAAQDVALTKNTADSFAYSVASKAAGAATQGAAYGGLATPDGGILVGTGDLTGLSVNTTETQTITQGGGDIKLGVTGNLSDTVTLEGFVGPSYQFLNQHNVSNTAVNIPGLSVAGSTLPTYSDVRTEDVNANYWGAIVGGNLSTKVSDTVGVELGGQIGIYNLQSSFSGSETFSVGGGSGIGGLPLATLTATNANTPSGTANSMAYSAKVNGAVSMDLNESTSVALGASAEYLSAVPVVSHATPSLVSATGGADTTYTGAPGGLAGATPALGFASMVKYTGTISLLAHF